METSDENARYAPMLHGLVETALFVEDLPRASAFYEQALGLEKIKAATQAACFAWMISDIFFSFFATQPKTQTQHPAARFCRRVHCPNNPDEGRDMLHLGSLRTHSIRGERD